MLLWKDWRFTLELCGAETASDTCVAQIQLHAVVVKKVRWARRSLFIILVGSTNSSSFQNSHVCRDTWASPRGYNVALMLRHDPRPTVLTPATRNHSEPKTNLIHPAFSSTVPRQGIYFFTELLTCDVPKSTKYSSSACPVPSPVKGIVKEEKKA